MSELLPRLSLRTRLSLIYGSLFLVTGAVLLALMYIQTSHAIDKGFNVQFSGINGAPTLGQAPDGIVVQQQAGDLGGGGATITRNISGQITKQKEEVLQQLLQNSLIAIAVLGLLAVGIGYIVAGRMMRPLKKVTRTARRLSESNLHERIGLDGPKDEIRELADTFDAMLERLDRAFDGQRRFVGNASHELRTPLAIQRTLLEVSTSDPAASDDVHQLAKPLLATNERSERLIDGLLLLAQSEQELRTRQHVELDAVVTDAIQVVEAEAVGKGINIRSELTPVTVEGDPVLLEHLVMNLCQNAVRHNVPGGDLHISCRQADGEVTLTVANAGHEIAVADVPSLFEPFRRGRDRINGDRGVGLGLSVTRAVAFAHGGRVGARPRPGGGLVVEVRLPVV